MANKYYVIRTDTDGSYPEIVSEHTNKREAKSKCYHWGHLRDIGNALRRDEGSRSRNHCHYFVTTSAEPIMKEEFEGFEVPFINRANVIYEA